MHYQTFILFIFGQLFGATLGVIQQPDLLNSGVFWLAQVVIIVVCVAVYSAINKFVRKRS